MAKDTVLDDVLTVAPTPTHKLDADHFTAEDIDGVTESLFGSGSIGYASLQAAQTDAAIQNNIEFNANNYAGDTNNNVSQVTGFDQGSVGMNDDSQSPFDTRDLVTPFGSPVSIQDRTDLNIGSSGGQQTAGGNDINLLATVTSSVDIATGNAPAIPTVAGVTIQQTNTDTGGDHDDHTPPPVTPDIILPEIEIPDNVTIGPVSIQTTILNNTIQTVTNDIIPEIQNVVNDAIVNTKNSIQSVVNEGTATVDFVIDTITDGGVAGAKASVVETAKTIAQPIVDTTSPIVTQLLNTTNNVVGGVVVEVDALTDAVTDEDVAPVINEIVGGIDTGLASIVNDIIGSDDGADTDVALSTPVTDGLDIITDVPVDNIEINAVEDIVGDTDNSVAVDTEIIQILDPTPSDDTVDDGSDITVLGDVDVFDNDVASVDIEAPLDPVESIIGDVDLGVESATDILSDNADDVIDAADGGGADDTITATIGDTVEAVAEPILTPVIESTPEIEIEIDLDVTESLSLLDGTVNDADVGDQAPAVETETFWADSSLSDGTGLFDDLIGNTVDGIGGVLPDPTGDITEGLGALDTNSDHIESGLGGLF